MKAFTPITNRHKCNSRHFTSSQKGLWHRAFAPFAKTLLPTHPIRYVLGQGVSKAIPQRSATYYGSFALLGSIFALLLAASGTHLFGFELAANNLPTGVTLQAVDGGANYFSQLNANSAWADQHILLGGWLEQPLNTTEVGYDAAMGNNIYWNLAGNPLDTADCGGAPCRTSYETIRNGGMHASAPDYFDNTNNGGDSSQNNGSETVLFDGNDETEMGYGPGSNGWNSQGSFGESSCIPQNTQCGYTISQFFYNGTNNSVQPAGATPSYPTSGNQTRGIHQGFGKGVLFWESDTQAAQFLRYSDVESADSYWMTDTDLKVSSQGDCALFPNSSTICNGGGGSGLSAAQSELPANYAYNVTKLEQEDAYNGNSKPVVVDVETGCPGSTGNCTTVPAFTAAAWHALIAGARGIIWFQHNFSGCDTDTGFYDGSDPSNLHYNSYIGSGTCATATGSQESFADMVQGVSAVNHEITSLNDVLLSDTASGYVSTTADVSTMAKYDASNNEFYVFAGSGTPGNPPAANQSATFSVAGGYTGPVTVLYTSENGPESGTIQATNGQFTDTFPDQNSVHIYEIPNTGAGGPSNVPTVTIAADPTQVDFGGTSSLSWSSTNATSCTASQGWSGSEPTSGSSVSTGALDNDTSFTITCTGSGGTTSAFATVSVTPRASESVAPPPSTNTVWPAYTTPTTTDSNDPTSLEVGMKFQSTEAGFIHGVRFYKGVGNTGTHVGSLWSSSGTLLARVTFSNETTSGWQQAFFSSSVAISANTTYVVSYFDPGGDYSFNSSYFGSSWTNSPLIALQNNDSGGDGGNGVFAVTGSPTFPNQSFNASNYWVDAIFGTQSYIPPIVSITAPANNAVVSGSSGISASAMGYNATIHDVQFQIDGEDISGCDPTVAISGSTYTCATWDATSLSNGTHTVSVIATDSNGHLSTVSEQVTVNNPQTPGSGSGAPTGSGASQASSGSKTIHVISPVTVATAAFTGTPSTPSTVPTNSTTPNASSKKPSAPPVVTFTQTGMPKSHSFGLSAFISGAVVGVLIILSIIVVVIRRRRGAI